MKYHILSTWLSLLIISYPEMNTFKELPTKLLKPMPLFLYRNIRHCPIDIKYTCYKSMVWSIVEYASPIWDPYTPSPISINLKSSRELKPASVLMYFSRLSSITAMLTSLDLASHYFSTTSAYREPYNCFHECITFNIVTRVVSYYVVTLVLLYMTRRQTDVELWGWITYFENVSSFLRDLQRNAGIANSVMVLWICSWHYRSWLVYSAHLATCKQSYG